MKKKYLKTLAEKWGELVTELNVASGLTLPIYHDGREIQKAAIKEIRRLRKMKSILDANAELSDR